MTWIQTYPTNTPHDLIKAGLFCIEDAAWAISQINRYTGHTKWPYSVAQHCVLMSRWIEDQAFALEALVHDLHEAYVGDVSSPLKKLLGEPFKKVDRRHELMVRRRFDLPDDMAKQVKVADLRMLLTERRDLQGSARRSWDVDSLGLEPYEHKIPRWSADFARKAWHKRLAELQPPRSR